MPRALLLLTVILAVGVSVAPADVPPRLRLARGHELVYIGNVHEEEPGQGGQAGMRLRTWQLDVRALTLEFQDSGNTLAIQTSLRPVRAAAARGDAAPAAIRLELVGIDAHGKLMGDSPPIRHSLEGPSTCELGFFVEFPADATEVGNRWLVGEAGRPPRRYRVAGTEPVNGLMCLKIEGEQQSVDWDRPRADSRAWRLRETLWITPRTGHAQRVRRILERREPAHREATYRLVTEYELDNWTPYRDSFFEDRRREIMQAKTHAEKVLSLLPEAVDHGPRPFETIIIRINQFAEKYPETPYRESLWQARRLAEAGRRGEVPPNLVSARARQTVALAKPAPDFVATDVTSGQDVTLHRWRGRTLLMAFYHPRSATAFDMLQRLQALQDGPSAGHLSVVAFLVSDDREQAATLAKRLSLTLPQVSGMNLRASYAVETTPRFVIVDREGIVFSLSSGWGPETPAALAREIERCAAGSR